MRVSRHSGTTISRCSSALRLARTSGGVHAAGDALGPVADIDARVRRGIRIDVGLAVAGCHEAVGEGRGRWRPGPADPTELVGTAAAGQVAEVLAGRRTAQAGLGHRDRKHRAEILVHAQDVRLRSRCRRGHRRRAG